MTEKENKVVLSVKNLNVYFKTHGKDSHVIRGVNLDINKGEVFAIVGESGSGKSVFTKTFTGMLESNGKIKTGSIILNDVELKDPKETKILFKDIHRHDRKLNKEARTEANALFDRKEKKSAAFFEKRIAKLEKEKKLNTTEGFQEHLREKVEKKHKKQIAYLSAFYVDKLTVAYNNLSNNAIFKQKISDQFLKKVNLILEDEKFQNSSEHAKLFSEILNKKISENSKYTTLISSIEKLDENIKSVESFKEKYSLINKKINLAKKSSTLYEKIFIESLLTYRMKQEVFYPLNPAAFEDFIDFVKTPVTPLISSFIPEKEQISREIDSEIEKLVEENLVKETPTEEKVKLVAGNVITKRKELLGEFAKLYKEKSFEELDFKELDLFSDKFFFNLGISKKVQNFHKSLSLYTDTSNLEYVNILSKLRNLESEIFVKSYDDTIKDLVEKINQVSYEHKANIRLFYSYILEESEESILQGVNAQKEKLSLRVKEVKEAQEKALENENNILNLKLQEISKIQHDFAGKVSKLDVEIAKLNEDKDKVIADLESKKEKLISEYKNQNASIIEAGLDPKFLTYPPILVKKYSAQKDLSQRIRSEIEEKEKVINEKKEKIIEIFDVENLSNVTALCKEIGFDYKHYVSNLKKAQETYKIGVESVELKKKELADDSRKEELLKLFDIEEETVKSTFISTVTQISNEFKKALAIFTPERNKEIIRLNTVIHNIDCEVPLIRRAYRSLKSALTIKTPMVTRLRNDGVIRGNSINLAKLKNNREWSMIRGSHVATIFQDPMTSLNPLLTIGSQISDVLRLHHNLTRAEAKAEAISLLEKVHIPNPEERYKEYPYQYSGGMRQRVVIAIALACRPDVLICDEPTTALDVTVQAQILDLIKELQKEYNFTTIFITHDLGVVAGIADRIGVMYGGQFIEIGTDEDIFYHSAHPYTWALLSSLPQLAVDNEPLVYIRGNPPVFTHEIAGDAFAPRSDYAMRIDTMIEPPMFKISETHYAKTWLLDPRAPKVKKPTIIRNLSERMKKTAESFLATEKGE